MKEPIKYHLALIEIIEKLNAGFSGTVIKPKTAIHGEKAALRIYRKGFEIEWTADVFKYRSKKYEVGKNIRGLSIKTDEYTLNLNSPYIRSHQNSTSKGTVFLASIDSFHSNRFKKSNQYYFRLIIPLKKQLDTHYYIEHKTFCSDLGYSSSCGTSVEISGDNLQACIIHKSGSKQYYLSIESNIKQGYESFSDKAHAFKNGIGYISGYLPADAGFYFAYGKNEMKEYTAFCFQEWRNAIISGYQPLYANPFGYVRERKIADKLYKNNLLRPMLKKEFSSLCQRLYDSKEFTGVVILILEASIASLLFMPGGFAIALESMADIIIGNVKIDRSLIADKTVRDRIVKQCINVVETETANLVFDNKKVLISKLQQLNQGTNQSRLRAPFDLLSIALSDEDLKIINTRNDFLHGRVPDITLAGQDRSEKRKGKDMYYAAVRLYTLLNQLILKWVGYDNYVLNHAKIQEQATGIKLNENYYVKL